MISSYKIIQAHTVRELETAVNGALQDGWRLHLGMVASPGGYLPRYIQVMVKE